MSLSSTPLGKSPAKLSGIGEEDSRNNLNNHNNNSNSNNNNNNVIDNVVVPSPTINRSSTNSDKNTGVLRGNEMEIPVDEQNSISGEGQGFFVTEGDDGDHVGDSVFSTPTASTIEVPDGAKVSKLLLKSSCLGLGGDEVGDDDVHKNHDGDNNVIVMSEELMESVDETPIRNEQDLAKVLDELSVTKSVSDDFKEDFKEAVTSNFRRQSILPVDTTDDDFISSYEWKMQKRHVFVLSEAGKPIYSRYGNEDNLVTLFGLFQALASVVQDNDDTIRSIHVGQTTIVFLAKSPLILVCVSRLGESVTQTQTQLMYFYNQIVSILTSKQLFAIFEKRRNYDLRRLLSGSERLLDNLGNLLENDPSFILGAVKCLPLASSVRETISQTIIQNLTKSKNVVFAILISNNQLVSLVRMKKCFMHPMDLHIILNLIDSSESFKTAESWTPLCLPRFDSSGFVHGHVSYLADDCQACLVLLTVDRDSFFPLSEAKQKIVERLRRHNCLEAINASMNNNWPTMSYVNVSEVRHFIYKSRSIAQFTAPALDIPYTNNTSTTGPSSNIQGRNVSPELQRIYSSYFKIHSRLHCHSKPLKLIYCVDETENWIGWVTSTFELYVAFEPLVKKSAAINAVNKLLKWVKKEEERIFIMNSPTFT